MKLPSGKLDRMLAAKPPADPRERLAMTIYESACGEWWQIATRRDRKIARKQADAAIALYGFPPDVRGRA